MQTPLPQHENVIYVFNHAIACMRRRLADYSVYPTRLTHSEVFRYAHLNTAII